jgi:hypothetical protein
LVRDLAAMAGIGSPGDRCVVLAWFAEACIFGFLADDPAPAQLASETLLDQGIDPTSRGVALPMVTFHRAFIEHRSLTSQEVDEAVAAADAVDPFHGYLARANLDLVAPHMIGFRLITDAEHMARRHGHVRLADHALARSAMGASIAGRSGDALAAARAALPRVIDDPTYDPNQLAFLAMIEGEHGDLSLGVTLVDDITARMSGRGVPNRELADSWVVAGHLHRLAGNLSVAQAFVDRAARRVAALPPVFIRILNCVTASALERARGEPLAAARHLDGLVAEWIGATDGPMRLLEEAVAVAVDLGRVDDGADLLATAKALRAEHVMPVSPTRRPEIAATERVVGADGRVLGWADLRATLASMATS